MTPIKQLRKRIIVHTPGFKHYRSKHLLLKKENFDAMIEIMPHRDKVRVCIYLFRKIDNKQKWAMNPIFFDGSEEEVTATIKDIVHVFEHDTVEFVTEAIRTLPHNVHSKLTQITMS